MGKSKTRSGRRRGAAPTVQQLATKKAGRNFLDLMGRHATEGVNHRLTLELESGKTSTLVTLVPGEEPHVTQPEVVDFLIACLAMDKDTAIILETMDPDGSRFVRVWVVTNGTINPMEASEVRASMEEVDDDPQLTSWKNDKQTSILDAYPLHANGLLV